MTCHNGPRRVLSENYDEVPQQRDKGVQGVRRPNLRANRINLI
jgi:hypothetical protein